MLDSKNDAILDRIVYADYVLSGNYGVQSTKGISMANRAYLLAVNDPNVNVYRKAPDSLSMRGSSEVWRIYNYHFITTP
jgi:hypothetical protein